MVRGPLSENRPLKKGAWSPEEDRRLIAYIKRFGIWNWNVTPKAAGLLRSGKSCRLRWVNYLRPDIKRGNFSKEEEETILKLHEMLGNKWSAISAKLSGRTDNEIKNYWHSHLKKRLKDNNIPALRTDVEEVETTKCDAIQNHLLAETNLLPLSSVNIIQVSKPEAPLTIPMSDPAVQIDEYMKTIEVIGSPEEFGELSSFWAQPFSVEDLYMEDLQVTYVDPGFIVPISQVRCQEPSSPYGFYNDLCSDFWISLQIQAEAEAEADATKEPNVYF